MAWNTKDVPFDGVTGKHPLPSGYVPDLDAYRPPSLTEVGNQRWAQDVVGWGKTASGVYVPTKVADDGTQEVTDAKLADIEAKQQEILDRMDGKFDTQLTGSNVKLATSDYDQLLSVAANGGATTIEVKPPAGELWRVYGLYLEIGAPAGATTGTHYIVVVAGGVDTVKNSKLRLSSTYGTEVRMRYNVIEIADNEQVPNNHQAQTQAINSLVATNANPLRVYYQNLTDVVQDGTLEVAVDREVEQIV